MEEDIVFEMNGWILTDDSCYQYINNRGNNVFDCIQIVWLDTVEGDPGWPDKEYVVESDTIKLDDYSKEDIEAYISSYGYDSIERFYDFYKDVNEARQIIAECIFESNVGLVIFGMAIKKQAEEFILNYIKTH